MKHLTFVYLYNKTQHLAIETIDYRLMLPYHMCVGLISNDGELVSPSNVHKSLQVLL